MERRFIFRGFGVGAVGGLLCFVFARIVAEPVIQSAIDYETGRDAAEKVRKAAGLAPSPAGPEIVSRGIQGGIGIGTGLVVFGIAMGGLFAVAYFLVYRRTQGRIRPRTLSVLIAAAGFIGLYLVPYLKYPANPPAIGHPDTIRARGAPVPRHGADLAALALGLAGPPRVSSAATGGSGAALLSGLGFVVVIAVAMAILPPLGHLHSNVVNFGRHATETPQPLRDAKGVIVYPGFPADVLFEFRLYSVLNQLILWERSASASVR